VYVATLQRVRSSIARLGVTSIDLLQLHWEPQTPPPAPSSSSSKGQPPPPGYVTAAKVLKELQLVGLIKQWGVSNFDVPMLLALQDAGLKPVSNQVGLGRLACDSWGVCIWST
jgi:diketogulonate reductase-like aldo/keto reductase